jgi:hypothetical protein
MLGGVSLRCTVSNADNSYMIKQVRPIFIDNRHLELTEL